VTVSRRLAAIALGAGAARLAYRELNRRQPGGPDTWTRKNHRGEPVTLLEGPALVAGTAGAIALAPGLPRRLRTAAMLAALSAGALGSYDDLAGSGSSRGLRGHFDALARGEVTTGAVKVLGIGAAGLLAGALVQRKPADKLLAGIVIAGSANLVNLLDLRPGRAIKAGLIAGAPVALARSGSGSGERGPGRRGAGVLAAGSMGAAAALLPEDLGERAMLGDAGANALGAALGVAAAAGSGRVGLLLRAASIIGLTLASEKVSFTKVIAASPPLNAIDMLGRRPVPTE
jgi:UDP-N-acetylmuramyl pentapeptide phosphotransferase/UDP-N-acetylglucosamine-1-phosphate transferase